MAVRCTFSKATKETNTMFDQINRAANWAATKSGSSARLAVGITGNVVATGTNLAGCAVAVSGGILAAAGVGAYAGGCYIMDRADKLGAASQRMADKAMQELRTPSCADSEVVYDVHEMPAAPVMG